MFMSSITRWRSGLTGASRTEWVILVEEARHALPLPDNAQWKPDLRPELSTSTPGAPRASGFVLRLRS